MPPQAYNPSIVALPPALRAQLDCTRCAFAATVRVDWMTQCDGFSGPLRLRLKHAIVTKLGRRKATLFMLLDEQLAPLRWGWLQAEANHQAAASSLWSSVALNAAL